MKARQLSAHTAGFAALSHNALATFVALALTFSFPLCSPAYAADAADVSEQTGDGSAENPVIITTEQTDADMPSVEEIMAALYAASEEEDDASLDTLSTSEQVVELYGDYQYDTAAEEAFYSFSSSEYAIIASGVTAVDALSATALAGALDCPILLASTDYLPEATADVLRMLGVSKPILVGGTSALTEKVAREVAQVTNAQPLRLWGAGIIDTQLAIYQYGKENNLWGTDVIIAQGIKSYADALSFSPVAYKLKAPIFLVDSDGLLPAKSQKALKSGGFTRALIGGGEAAVALDTEELMPSLLASSKLQQPVVRLGGRLLYDTSAEIAKWAVKRNILTWDNAAFATGKTMTDSLAGSAVQARDNSVILLIDEGYYSTLKAIAAHKSEITQVKIFGGPVVVTGTTRTDIANTLGFTYHFVSPSTYTYEYYPLTVDEFAQMEVGYKVNSDGSRASADDILEYMDPTRYDNTTSEYMEFVDIGAGYTGISAQTLDNFIAANCTYWESYYGTTSNMRGLGSAIVEAAETYNVNEAYLLAHAAIESAWGCSYLARGIIKVDGEWVECGYLNFFGIGAFDSDPQNGASMGRYYGWDSPRTAMLGGAYWISRYYVHSGSSVSGDQNTLWKMAWDVNAAIKNGSLSGSHQYATGRTWAISIAKTMDRVYTKHMGRYFDFDELGITAIVPVFAE